MTKVDDLEGVVLGQRYRLRRLIAHGGMGRVFEATQLSLDRAVAVKVMSRPRRAAQRDEFRRRFEREAEMLSRVRSPYTVSVFDFGEDQGLHYIVMELLQGHPLRRLIDQSAPFDVHRAVSLASQIAEALTEAHEHGVLHRDLKPSNVFVLESRDEERVKVLDFGIGKRLVPSDDEKDLTQSGIVLGSPLYMAPEQFSGARVDTRTDIYGLGLCLFEMLAGTNPFVHRGRNPKLPLPLEATKVPLLRHVTPYPVPSSVESLVASCLAREMEDRPRSMREVLGRLRALRAQSVHPVDELLMSDEPTRIVDFQISRDETGAVDAVVARPSNPVLEARAAPPGKRELPLAPPAPGYAGNRRPIVALIAGPAALGLTMVLATSLWLREPDGDPTAATSPADAPPGPSPRPGSAPTPVAPGPRNDASGTVALPPVVARPSELIGGSNPTAVAEPEGQRGTMYDLTSDPPGALVELDGLEIGRTPVTFASADAGRLTFVFRLEGHATSRRSPEPDPGRVAPVHAVLSPVPQPKDDELSDELSPSHETEGSRRRRVRRRHQSPSRERPAARPGSGASERSQGMAAPSYRDDPYAE